MKRRYIFSLGFLLCLCFFAFSLFLYKKNHDTLIAKISVFLQAQSDKLPLNISKPESLQFDIFKRTISLKKISISSKNKMKKNLLFEPFEISSLEFYFSFQDIISFTVRRRFHFNEVTAYIDNVKISFDHLKALPKIFQHASQEGSLHGSRFILLSKKANQFINFNFPKASITSSKKSRKIYFKKLIPVTMNFNIKHLSFTSKSMNLNVKDIFLSSKPNTEELSQEIRIKEIHIKTKKHRLPPLSLDTNLLIKNNLLISFKKFKLNYLKSKLDFSGNLSLRDNKINLFSYKKWNSQIFLNSSDFSKIGFKGKGLIKFNLDYEPSLLTIKVKSQNFQFKKNSLGYIESHILLDSNKIVVKEALIKNNRGESLFIKNSILKRHGISLFDIKLNKFRLGKIFHRNLSLKLTGLLFCTLNPFKKRLSFNKNLPITCKTKENFLIEHMELKNKFSAKNLNSYLFLNYENKILKYESRIRSIKFIGESSLGENRHAVTYEGRNVNLSQFDKIYNYYLEGFVTFKGKALLQKGKAQMEAQTNLSKVKFNNLSIKKAQALLNYKNQKIFFKNLLLQFDKTYYKGMLSLDFKKKMSYFDIFSPNMKMSEISQIEFKNKSKIFHKVFKNFLGEGSMKVVGTSDFDMEDLTFDLKTDIFRGSLFKDYFDHIKLNITSQKNQIKIEDSFIQRDKDKIFVSGNYSNKNLNVKVYTDNFYLEPFLLKDYLPIVKGSTKFNLLISGNLKNPVFKLNGRLRNDLYSSQNNKILFQMKINENFISCNADFFKKSLLVFFKIPRKKYLPFSINGSTKKFDISKLIPKLKKHQGDDFKVELDSRFKFTSKNSNFFNSYGYLKDGQLKITSGQHSFHNKVPLHLTLSKGTLTSQSQLEIYGKARQFIKLKNNLIVFKKRLNIHMEGNINAKAFQFLSPAIAIADGESHFFLKIVGDEKNLNSNGYFNLRKGFLKLKDFKHSLEQIQMNLNIVNNKVSIDSFKANINDTPSKISGHIKIFQKNAMPLDLSLKMSNFNLEYPKGLQTKGNLNLSLKGRKHPYKLSGFIKIKEGKTSSDLGKKSSSYIYPSVFLKNIGTKKTLSKVIFDQLLVEGQNLNFLNKNLNFKVSGHAYLLGSFRNPILEGRANILPESSFEFQNNKFFITRGSLSYQRDFADNPRVFILAYTPVETGKISYKIDIKVEGFAKKNQITLSSTPPLNRNEILRLLRSRITPEDLDDLSQAQNELASEGIYQVSSFIFSNLLGDTIRNNLGLNVRILPSEDTTENNTLIVPKIKVEKQISDSLNLSISRTFGVQEKNNINLIYKLSNKWSLQASWEDSNKSKDNKATDSSNTQSFDINLEYKRRFK